ncbi:MAG TPA: FtsK/SpoIIIE domain-containing protein, partial [Microbacteriaceae bacterium]|nr:FtsK/SpoIIIE domain-containing protein [Microbacteriaceae bacterium]
ALPGIGVAGPPALAWSVTRGYLVQLLDRLPPGHVALCLPAAQGIPGLPHCTTRTAEYRIEVLDAAGQAASGLSGAARAAGAARGTIRVVVAAQLERIPPTIDTVIQVLAPGVADIVQGRLALRRIAVEHVSRAQFERFAAELRRHADLLGLTSGAPAGPVLLEDLSDDSDSRAGRGGLPCPVGLRDGVVCRVDLVRDGPHAVVGGTTGSGKSELLTTWVAAMARAASPREVAFLLIDFKGGAAFQALRTLPHCVGVITDLDEAGARRAVTSLAAEVRRRERLLAAAGATDVSDPACATRLGRLVIVVDEFQSLLRALPDLDAVFTDIAARGRSLGMHLILCTQRPAGVVREALLANCGLRLCLRVHAKADSEAVIGDGRAALLPVDAPGRCLVGQVGAAGEVQIALTSNDLIDGIRERYQAAPAPDRPWLDPLPDSIDLQALQGLASSSTRGMPAAASGVFGFRPWLGMVDDPAGQRQYPARYDAAAGGALLCVGDAGSGKTTLLESLAAQGEGSAAGARILRGVEECWDAVQDAAEQCLRPGGAILPPLLLDDLDALLARLGDDYAHEFAEALGLLLREGGRRVAVVAACRRLAGPMNALADLFTERLLLRIGDRADYLVAGGEAGLHDARLPAGGGTWHGRRIQIATASPADASRADAGGTGRAGEVTPGAAAAQLVPVEVAEGALIVSRRPGSLAERLRAGGVPVVELDPGRRPEPSEGTTPGAEERPCLVADPESWQSAWALFHAYRARLPVVFEACTPVDVRMLTRRRTLPPVLEPYRGHVWVLDTRDRLRRGILVTPGTAAAR